MKVCRIVLGKKDSSEIKLCEINTVENFLKRNFAQYGISKKEIEISKNDDNLIMKLMPYITIDNENAFFSNVKEYKNFINRHKDIEVVQIYEGFLY